jgi:hypothetical protein
MGQDDNIYRTPAEPYVDLSDPTQPLVTPVVQSASYVPVDVLARYRLHAEASDTDFQFSYELDGDFYDAEFSNATRVSQRAGIGGDVSLGEHGKRRRSVSSELFFEDHRESNFDPDSGIDRSDANGLSIADRFSYQGPGLQTAFAHRLGAWQWDLHLQAQHLDYEHTEPPVASYDHDYFFAGVSVDYDFNAKMTLSFGLRRYERDYYELPARDLNGNMLSTNPETEYDYTAAQIGMRRRITDKIDVSLDYMRLERVDQFVGYYDYTQDIVRLRAVFWPSPRVTLSLGALGRTYDYPNAFAFNEPTAGPRELDETAGELHAEFSINRHVSLWAEAYLTDVTSTDARAAYSRTQTTIGASWRR